MRGPRGRPGRRALAGALVLLPVLCHCREDGLARLPPMGWRSWNLYGGGVNQTRMLRIMDGMARRTRLVDGRPTSLCDLGYCDVGLDDGWQDPQGPQGSPRACRARRRREGVPGRSALAVDASPAAHVDVGNFFHDVDGNPLVDYQRFPDMRAMTDSAHRLGLKAGWYANNCICKENNTHDRKYYEGDVRAFQRFGFDSWKLDACGAQMDLQLYDDLLHVDGSAPVLVENCHWGRKAPAGPNRTWCPWHMYRTSDDLQPAWWSVVYNLASVGRFARKNLSTPGCWAHADMLMLGAGGKPGLTPVELRTHFGAWAIISSPLVLSHDVNDDAVMDELWPLISNTEVIGVSQSYAGFSGGPFKQAEERVLLAPAMGKRNEITAPVWEFFYKPLDRRGTRVAVLLLNHGTAPADLPLHFADVPGLACTTCGVRDIWRREDLGQATGSMVARAVQPHDSAFLILTPAGGPGSGDGVISAHGSGGLRR